MIESQKLFQQVLISVVVSGNQMGLASNFAPDALAGKIAGNHRGLRGNIDSILEFRFFYGVGIRLFSYDIFGGDFEISIV